MALTKAQFNKLYQLNPNGDPSQIMKYLNYELFDIENGSRIVVTNYTQEKVTFAYLYKKYEAYINWWNITFGKRKPEFIAKTDKKINIHDFVADKVYEQTFIIPKKDRDIYLFGNFSDEYIKNRTKQFIERIGQDYEQESDEEEKSDIVPF